VNIFETMRMAWNSLITHPMRALLTMLGIIIGVGSMIGMQSIGTGFQNYMAGEFNRLGAGVVYFTPAFTSEELDKPITPRLTAADAEALLAPGVAPDVQRIAYEFSGTSVVSAGGDRFSYTLNGVSMGYFTINAHSLASGRFFTEAESNARIAVIGTMVASDLFGGTHQALSQRISIDGVEYEVIGVNATRSSQATGGANDPTKEVYLPYTSARNRIFRNQMTPQVDVSRVIVQARDPKRTKEAMRQVTIALRERHRLSYQPNGFNIQDLEQTAQQSQRALAGFTSFLLVIGGISLLVGGIGIMNIMLVSVTQRTREIGLRKAVGARQRDILLQFLVEASLLSLAGGMVGIMLGYLLSFAGTYVMRVVFLAPATTAVVTLHSIVIACGVSAVIGILFGLFPALRAAGLQPVKALRAE
jgi:putative ABC transport system permease protein